MEEDKEIKVKKIIKNISKVLSYAFITILMIVASFLIYYVISGKIAEKNGKTPSISLYTIISPSMVPNINVHDVVFVKKTNTDKLKVGDVITFYSTNAYFGGTPITHRIIEILDVPGTGKMFRVKGDANATADEEKVKPSNIIGKVLFKIPKLGKIQYYLASKTGYIIAILIPSLIIISYDIYKIIKLLALKNKINSISNENKKEINEIEENRIEEKMLMEEKLKEEGSDTIEQ